jgi:uncharacterized protein
VKIVDTNLLLYAANRQSPLHAQCRTWLEAALEGEEAIGLAWVVLLGFVRIATNPRAFSQPLSASEAIDRVNEWLAASCSTVIEPGEEHWRLMREMLGTLGTAGNLTTDIHLAALAIERGATLVSCDSDFSRFKRLKWENPVAVP